MHGDIREGVAEFYTELTQRLLGGIINLDHINVPCDIVHAEMDVSVEVKAAGTPESPFIFTEQLESHLDAAEIFPNPTTCLYALWRYRNAVGIREGRKNGHARPATNVRRLAKRATTDEKLEGFLASETMTLVIIDARILRLMSLRDEGTVNRLRWNKPADIVAGGITALRNLANDTARCLAAINEEIRDYAEELVLDPASFASIETECRLTFRGRQMAFPAMIVVEKTMLELLRSESRSLKRFFPKKR